MNELINSVIDLAILIRDSEDGKRWIKNWNSLIKSDDGPRISTDDLASVPIADSVRLLCTSNQIKTRPFLFPYVIQEYFPPEERGKILQELKTHPHFSNKIDHVITSSNLMTLIISFLRKNIIGYPNDLLIYTQPQLPWSKISRVSEVPYRIGEEWLPKIIPMAEMIGWEQFAPSIKDVIPTYLNNLLKNIKENNIYKDFEESYKNIIHNRKIKREMLNIIARFNREFTKIISRPVLKGIVEDNAQDICNDLYNKSSKEIILYKDKYLAMEELIENIYWTLSHIMAYKTISCLNSASLDELQQINIGFMEKGRLTAITRCVAKTLTVGQLIHISIPQANGIFDGIYQITHWIDKRNIIDGNRIIFDSRCLFNLRLDEKYSANLFKNDASAGLGELTSVIVTPDGEEIPLPLIPTMSISETMFL